MDMKLHKSVMSAEVLETFANISPEGFFLDATLGDGGHAEAILSAHEQIQLVGFDRDAQAIERAEHRLARFANRVTFVNVCFEELDKELTRLSIDEISGAIFDLGISSNQLDDSERGFSFQTDGQLDMRMNQSQEFMAADIINEWSEEEIANILYSYGDERNSRSIAAAIVENRPLYSTIDLAELIKSVSKKFNGIHPATRSFQALRICVNRELEQIVPALEQVTARLIPKGRVAILSYHSGEDSLVKAYLRDLEKEPDFSLISRKAKKPTQQEIEENPRARSARFRSFEYIPI